MESWFRHVDTFLCDGGIRTCSKEHVLLEVIPKLTGHVILSAAKDRKRL